MLNEETKKVCCITPINTPNYGTVLQAFALQEAVKQLGYEYTVLNYYSKAQELKFSFWGSTPYMNWKYKVAKKVLYPLRSYQLRQVLAFQNNNTNLSERIMTREELDDAGNDYDCFITGSDQVWNNQEINHFDDAFFLAFAQGKRKISYAASFGKTLSMLTEEDLEFYKKNIPLVDCISVREKSAIEIVEKTGGREAIWVCDPVFLVDSEKWRSYASFPKTKGYILVYLVGDGINFDVNKKIVSKAKELAKKDNKKVIVVGIGLASILYGSYTTPTVEEWLGLIKDADLLMTNAFHGTAFALLFGTPFYSYVSGGQDNRMNTRLYDLLAYCGLENRLIDLNGNADEKISFDIKNVNEEIIKFRENSMDFLRKSLE